MATQHSTQISPYIKDLTGQTFGLWHVIGLHSLNKWGGSVWLCRCKCGTEKPILSSNLTSGNSRQCFWCGIKGREKHGRTDTPEWVIWHGMLARCQNANRPDYSRYGGRGIAVSKRWLKFVAFFDDMGMRLSDAHSIERVDNDGDYCPENCCWATRAQQARNTSRNRLLTHNGQTLCLADWAAITGIAFKTLHQRLTRGWSVERALTTPVKPMKRKAK